MASSTALASSGLLSFMQKERIAHSAAGGSTKGAAVESWLGLPEEAEEEEEAEEAEEEVEEGASALALPAGGSLWRGVVEKALRVMVFVSCACSAA
jgi:hypothetical protein